MIINFFKRITAPFRLRLRKSPTHQTVALLNRIKELEATNNYILLLLEQEREKVREYTRTAREELLIKTYLHEQKNKDEIKHKSKKRGRPPKNHHTKTVKHIKQQNIIKES